MPYIPKKVVDRFATSVPKFQKVLKLAKDRDINESDTVEIITDILEAVFGYDKYLELTSEYAIRGRYCDIAVKIDDKVQFIMEAKAVGIDLKEDHISQAVGYAANHGVQWVILTNGFKWRLYRLRFEKPINYDLVHSVDFSAINPRKEKDQECLFLISREGLDKDAREEFYEKVQSVNRFVIANIMLAEPVLKVIKRELRKLSEGVKVKSQEVEQIVRSEVLRRNLVEGEDAEKARARVAKFYKKVSTSRRQKSPRKKKEESPTSSDSKQSISLSDRLLEESNDSSQSTTQQKNSPDKK